MHEYQNISRDEIRVIPKFSFKLLKTPCAELDFGKMKGIVLNHPKALKRMQDQGTKLSNDYNCRLCDVEGDEFNLVSPILNPIWVKCHAFVDNMRDNFDIACHAGNGKP